MKKILVDLFKDQRGMSPLVIMAILAAVGGIAAFGISNYLVPKIKGGGNSAGESIDDAISITY
ncbi:hypothetical protein [Desulforamulus aquiferis]|uniref:Uncharacterized protein n=1 Tax=Desulforamulus aquiferis TaxID=1397668 RepID=A0AAW7Z9M1_9FIRM|nr:hypothetical protein [Desulforamulus aquiferis]MDO7785804.1 hypothetical protein [Desulforamulus aquiferis]